MCMCNYFTMDDLVRSKTATAQGINNQPSMEIKKELDVTVCKLNLISVYVHLKGAHILVTSGYRCERLNELIGGVKSSLHMQGRAVDFVVSDSKARQDLCRFLKDPIIRTALGICEMIEYSTFLHVGFSRAFSPERG